MGCRITKGVSERCIARLLLTIIPVLVVLLPCLFGYLVYYCRVNRIVQSFKGILRRASLLSAIIFWFCVCFMIISCSATDCEKHSDINFANFLFEIFLPILWIMMLAESLASKERQYISNLGNTDVIKERVQILRELQPRILWTCNRLTRVNSFQK